MQGYETETDRDRTTYVGDEERTRGCGIAGTGFLAHAVSCPKLALLTKTATSVNDDAAAELSRLEWAF
jgi:hypothetical protein